MTDPLARALNRLAAATEAAADTPPPGVEPHPYAGDSDRHCQHPGCRKPDRNPIHARQEPTP